MSPPHNLDRNFAALDKIDRRPHKRKRPPANHRLELVAVVEDEIRREYRMAIPRISRSNRRRLIQGAAAVAMADLMAKACKPILGRVATVAGRGLGAVTRRGHLVKGTLVY
jgi:hypothetical protein